MPCWISSVLDWRSADHRGRPRTRAARLGSITLLMLLAGACVPHKPTRSYDPTDGRSHPTAACEALQPPAKDACGDNYPPDPAIRRASNSSVCTSVDELRAKGSIADYNTNGTAGSSVVACFSHERSRPSDGAVGLPHDPFDLHVVEFDDDGQPWNADREDMTIQQLQQELQKPAIVVTFIHGWKNDAEVCNGNIACFREVLEVLAKAETLYSTVTGAPPRRVIGVYIGWRGGTFQADLVNSIVTFWGRKHTAHVIGENGGVTALISRIRAIVEDARKSQGLWDTGAGLATTTHVMIGHSFGGALLFSALGTTLNGSIGEAIQSSVDPSPPTRDPCSSGPPAATPPLTYPTQRKRGVSPAQPLLQPARPVYVDSQGDLVILVNPATEASRYANLNQAVQVPFYRCQLPIFVTLASEADWAVGSFFPVGQSVATLVRSARSRASWLAMEQGLGLYEPYHTHRLMMKVLPDIPAKEKISDGCVCSSNLRAYGDALVLRLKPFYERLAYESSPDDLQLAAYQEFLFSRLEPIKDVDPNNPFMTVRIDDEIVGGHSDIFNARFLDFLIEFVVRTEVKRELVLRNTGGATK